MGMTLWFDPSDRAENEIPGDHSILFRHLEELNRLCKTLQLSPLSQFLDESSLHNEMAAELQAMIEEGTGEIDTVELPANVKLEELNPESPRPSSYSDPAEVLATVNALLDHLREKPEAFHFTHNAENESKKLVDELQSGRKILELTQARGAQIRLLPVT